MTRMIERWFPCAEVSAASQNGWGSGRQEKNLFTWFAARPTAQAKAAVLCSLLPWPESEAEQSRLQELVRRAMSGTYSAWDELRREIQNSNPEGASVLDPFSGRGMIPLEAARLGFPSFAIDYSPVAVMASQLLCEYPFRDWCGEPPLPFPSASERLIETEPRLLQDVRTVLDEVGRRFSDSMREFYPDVDGSQAWAYLWAVTLPCLECGHRFPLVGSYVLRKPRSLKSTKKRPAFFDPGQSYRINADRRLGRYSIEVFDGAPRDAPTLRNAVGPDGKKIAGKAAVCPFCQHSHSTATQRRMSVEGLGEDALLVVADLDEEVGKRYRPATDEDRQPLLSVDDALSREAPFGPLTPAVPNEEIPDNNRRFIQPIQYGARTYGDLMCARQTLSFVRLSRSMNNVAADLHAAGVSPDYVKALMGYAAAQFVRKLRRSTRGTTLQIPEQAASNIYANDSAIAFMYDFLETGIGEGPGTWASLSRSGSTTLKNILSGNGGQPAVVTRGSAASQPWSTGSMAAVVTDPPYDSLIYYTDTSDILYVWLKRALMASWPEFSVTADPRGLQEKSDEMIVKAFGAGPDEHRTRDFYDARMTEAFRECRRVVRSGGVVTIVFGHGEPEVWQRLLSAIHAAGLVMTGSWAANTESGSNAGDRKANIRTTLTMSCRPAPEARPIGRKGSVEAAIKAEVKSRYPEWERWGLAPTDMLMAAAGPAMEIVGKYSDVLDAKGDPVDISTFLPLARAAVQEAMAVEIDHHPLETFDARTRFALWWARLFGREIAPKSELRWQSLAASLELADVRDLVPDADKGCQLVTSGRFQSTVNSESAVIDVALSLAAVSDQGRESMGRVLADSGRDPQDAYLWACVKFLADRLPDSDPDSIAFNRVMRSREGIASASESIDIAEKAEQRDRQERSKQSRLF